jgi:site-specific DNA recombinase
MCAQLRIPMDVMVSGSATSLLQASQAADRQREASIDDQVRLCRGWVEREGALLAGTYTDHAVSGQIRMRPGYQKLLAGN